MTIPHEIDFRRHTNRGHSTSDRSLMIQNVWIFGILFAVFGMVTMNPLPTIAVALTVPIVMSLVWNRVESPVLVAGCAFQWLQAATPVIYADLHGTTIDDTFHIQNMEEAILLSTFGIIIFACGIRLSWAGYKRLPTEMLTNDVKNLNQTRLFFLWFVAYVVALAAALAAYKIKSIAQIIFHLASFKWIFYFILTYQTFAIQKGYWALLFAVTVEFVIGFSGYFSTYKEAIFMLIIVGLITHVKLRAKSIVLMGFALILVVVASIYWSAVKSPYRDYLRREGFGGSTAARLGKLLDMVSELKTPDLQIGFQKLVARISYTEYFARTLTHVPSRVPHANGELWFGAVRHVLTPRLLFPDKVELDDSKRARRFTGARISGAESATSIGIGYMGESYADFGIELMFIPVFILGLLYGSVYRLCVSLNRSPLMGVAVATAVDFQSLRGFEQSNVKIVGALITVVILMVAFSSLLSNKVFRYMKLKTVHMTGPRPT